MNYKMLEQSSPYLLYGVNVLTDILVPNDLPIKVTDVYFPKMAILSVFETWSGR
jgi:hypothetical protein